MSCQNNCNRTQDCNTRCHEVVQDASEVSFFRNAFVTVLNENAIYHTDARGNIISVSRNPIFNEDYTPTTGDYKMVTVYNFAVDEAYVFDGQGNYRIIFLTNPNGGQSS